MTRVRVCLASAAALLAAAFVAHAQSDPTPRTYVIQQDPVLKYRLKMMEAGGGTNYATFTVPSMASNTDYTYPSAIGAANTALSDVAGNGTLSWATVATLGAVTGSGTLNYIPKFTPSGTVLGNSQFIDDGTYVGLGIAAPLRLLHLKSSAVDTVIRIDSGAAGGGLWDLDSSGSGNATVGAGFSISQSGVYRMLINGSGVFGLGGSITTSSFTGSTLYGASTGEIGIGTVGPLEMLHVRKDTAGATRIRVENASAGANAAAYYHAINDLASIGMIAMYGSGTSYGAASADGALVYSNGAGGVTIMADHASGVIKFAGGGSTEDMRISAAGAVSIQNLTASLPVCTDGSKNLTSTGCAALTTVPFSGITTASNTVAAMTCGTGCSILASGSGTIDATTLLTKTWAIPDALGSTTPAAVTSTTLTANGNTTLGDATSDTITFTARSASDLLPTTDDTYSLGADANRWKDGFFGPDTVHIGTSTTDETALSWATSSNVATWSTTGSAVIDATSVGAGVALSLKGGTLSDLDIINGNSALAGATSRIKLQRSRGSISSPSLVSSGDYVARILGYGYSDASTSYQNLAAIDMVVDGTPDSGGDTTDMPGRILFSTAPDGGAIATILTRMSILNGGNIVMGGDDAGTTVRTGTTVRAPNVATGGAGNIAGVGMTLAAGLGTGTGTRGTLIFQTPQVATAGDNAQTLETILTLGEDTVTVAAGKAVNLADATVSQATNINTGVTINGASGVITTQSASTGTRTCESGFTVTNGAVASTSVVLARVAVYSGTYFTNGWPEVVVTTVSSGSFAVKVCNTDATNALSGTMKIHFAVL